jgi:hypothetical protein
MPDSPPHSRVTEEETSSAEFTIFSQMTDLLLSVSRRELREALADSGRSKPVKKASAQAPVGESN